MRGHSLCCLCGFGASRFGRGDGSRVVLAAAAAWFFALAAGLASGSEDLFRAVRNGDAAAVRAALAAGADANVRNARGETPLLRAAICAGPDVVRALLDAGADPNLTSPLEAAPLHRAAGRHDVAALLLDAGADARARSNLGNTPALGAARVKGSAPILRRLLEAGADPNGANMFGAAPLMAAAAAEDIEAVELLLDAGAQIDAVPAMHQGGFVFGGGRSALMWAAFLGNEDLLELLLERGADPNRAAFAGTPLSHAAWGGKPGAATILIDAGAEVDQRDLVADFTALHWAASSENMSAEMVELLVKRGADPNALGGELVDGFLGEAQSPLALAQRRGETPLVEALMRAGAKPAHPAASESSRGSAAAAVEAPDRAAIARSIARAIPPLQKTAADSYENFNRHASKQNCLSCHQQYLPMGAVGMARNLGLPVDPEKARAQIEVSHAHPTAPPDFEAQTTFHPESAIEAAYHLLGLHLEGQAPTDLIDAFVHHVALVQRPDGSWFTNMPRPPIQSSNIASTALGIYSLRTYPIPGRLAEFDQRVDRAAAWLKSASAESHEDIAYQLAGLAWAGGNRKLLGPVAAKLARAQRDDGGWGQLATLPSDAYATGLALFAIAQAGRDLVPAESIQLAAGFLLRTQGSDGSWHVRRRAFPFQPPMDSGFPHGADGWISAAGSSWAAMGLASLLTAAEVAALGTISAGEPTGDATAAAGPPTFDPNASHDFHRDIRPVLERSCIACHGGPKPKGGFALETRAHAIAGGNRGEPAVVPGDPRASAVIECVTDQIEDLEMPPLKKRDKFPPLSESEIASLHAWIAAGAPWPENEPPLKAAP